MRNNPYSPPQSRSQQVILRWRRLVSLLALCFPLLLHAQATREISGKVVDATAAGLPGVTVLVPGTQTGASTAPDGTFKLQVPASATTLAFSFVGYASQEVNIVGKSTVSVTMKDDAQALGDVVVVGYGTVKKSDLTGAVGAIDQKDFNKGTFTSPDQLIQGRASGVQVTNSSGQPGGAATVKIRGNSAVTGTGQPLYVVDGVALDGRSARPGVTTATLGTGTDSNPLNFLNPADIESVDILKDASATAIYGSRAAYGVVIITTKRGKAGQARLDVGASGGFSSILRRVDVLNADQFRAAIPYYGASATIDQGDNVDALGALLRTAPLQNYTAALSGGNENGRYRLSLGYLNQDGILRKTGFKKYSAQFTANLKFLESKKLGLDVNVVTSQFREQLAPITNDAGAQGSLIGQALQWNPTEALRKADGSLNIKNGSVVNPLAMSELYNDNSEVSTALFSVSPYYKFTDWLEFRTLYSANYSTGLRRTSIGQDLNLSNSIGRGYAAVGTSRLLTQQLTNTLNFNKKLGSDFNLNALLGYEYTRYDNSGTNIGALGPTGGFGNYGLDYTDYIQYSSAAGRTVSSFNDPGYYLQSYFGRAILNYKERYLLTATLRADGSSKFGENHRYGYFPSVSAAWDISQESFFKVKAITQLKLRAGYGLTGNQEFPAGSAQARYSFADNGVLSQVNSPNPDLKWQSDEQYDVGVDFALFNNRISVTADYFHKKTTDLLFPSSPVQPAPSTSVVRWVNLDGSVVNQGFEAAVNTTVIDNQRFGLSFNVNATFVKNISSGLPAPIYTGSLSGPGVTGVLVETIRDGAPINSFYTRQFLGIDPATGQASYADNGAVFRLVGNPNPRTLAGFSFTARYRRLSLTTNLNGVFGVDIYNNTLNSVLNVGQILGGKNIALSNYQSGVKEATSNPVTASSRFIENGSYVKLSNLALSYNLGDVGKVLKGASVYAIGQNLVLLTSYTGFDPEINTNKAVNSIPSVGIDYTGYPSARVFTFGVNFSL